MAEDQVTTATIDQAIPVPATVCAHHWILESDTSVETTGACRRCGASKTFQNHLPGDRYAKEWREARLYGTVNDRRLPAIPAGYHDDSAYD